VTTAAALASSFPDYSGLVPWFVVIVVAAGVGIAYAIVRVYRGADDDKRQRLAGIGRRVAIAIVLWLVICGVAGLLVTSLS
jgi:hypothetical protein